MKKSSVLKIEVFQDTYSKYIIEIFFSLSFFFLFVRVYARAWVCQCVHIHTGPKQAIAS